MTHRWRASSVVLAIAATVIACAYSAGGAVAATGKAASAKHSGKVFRIGVDGSFSGEQAAIAGAMPATINAWVKYTNAHGGLNGYTVQVYVKDDAGNASTALQNTEELVKQDHIQALVDLSQQTQAFAQYIDGTGIPVTGGATEAAAFGTLPNFFPSGGENTVLGYSVGAAAKAEGDRKMGALVCAEEPVCAGFFGPFGQILSSVIGGMADVYNATISASAPSYTAECIAAQQGGAQGVFMGLLWVTAERVIDQCAQQGIKLDYFVVSGDLTATVLKDPNANGITQTDFNIPVGDTAAPGGKLLQTMVTRYGHVQSNPDWNDTDVQPFAALQLFALDATTNKLTPASSPAKVRAGLYKLPTTTLGGIAPSLKFVKGKPTSVLCWFSAQVYNHKEILHDAKADCVPPAKVAAYPKLFG
jgi:branched-chain amino acid transport system substrate-binding protein